jgi:hypothetical protein
MSKQFALSLRFFAPDALTLQSVEANDLCQATKVAAGQMRLAPGPNQLNEDA